MKIKLKRQNKKGFWRLLTSVFVLAVIWQLVFFQCLAPLFYSKAIAEDNVSIAINEDEPSDQPENNDDAKEEELQKGEPANEQGNEEEITVEEKSEETDNSQEETAEEEAAETNPAEQTASSESAANPADETTEANIEGATELPGAESEILALTEILSVEEVDPENSNSENNNENCSCPEEPEENPPVISEDCLTICQTIEIENTNDATADNSASSDSQTGGNTIGENNSQPESINSEENNDNKENEEENEDEGESEDEPSDDPSVCEGPECPQDAIATGDAVAVSNIINDTNSNEVGNNFENLVINITGEENGEINLYEKFVELLENAGELTEEQKTAFTALLIENINNAQVANNASASAESGGNMINGADNALIETGDAAALANIINLINRNLVGNNWLFSVINVLGTWNGDLIVPGEGLLTVPQSSQAFQVEITNENKADVSNSAEAEAETGNNNISGASSATIKTGEAQAASTTINIINTNIVRDNWFFLLINNMGSWLGNIFNWDGNSFSGVFQYDFGVIDPSSEISSGGILKVKNTNNAVVENNASAYANTGANYINNAGNAAIETGNASALARIFNFINTNIVGNNWMFAMVNVMGEWNGNLEFAYPDLAVSINDGKDKAQAGETLVYDITVKNNGKADCDDVSVAISLDKNMRYQSDNSGDSPAESGGSYIWNISGLKRGEEKNFKVTAKISEELDPGNYTLQSAAGVTTRTKEIELADNASSDFTGVAVPFPALVFENGFEKDFDSHLSIKREMDGSGTVRPGEYVKYTFYIENKGDAALYDVMLEDKMKGENGEEIAIYQWPIGDMAIGQKIMVDYTLQANNIGRPATFVYEAQAYGEDPNEDEVKSRKVGSILTILGFVNSAQAFEALPSEIAGAETTSLPEAVQSAAQRSLPLWIFLAALVAYYLAINWSMVRKKVSHKK